MLSSCTPDRMGWRCTAEAVGGAITYLGALVSNRRSICSRDCGPEACQGQRFAREFGKCIDDNGVEQTLYKYKDYTRTDNNFLTGRADVNGTLGIVPYAANELGRVITNSSISNALIGEMPIRCKPATLECLRIDVTGNNVVEVHGGRANRASQNTGSIHIENNELEELKNRGYVVSEPMSNINDNEDDNEDDKYYKINNNNNIEDIYFILLSLFIIYISYKLIYKNR
tara:strand:- start:35 stop:718 length:684 start_codon:yes stop_codon:yes gene_type:complete